jgi:ribonuclease H2 subunit A
MYTVVFFLGPMVYGICYCPLSKAENLKALGCADSKSLTEEKRELIFEKLCKETEYIGWAIEAISPNIICNSMLRRYLPGLKHYHYISCTTILALVFGHNHSKII